MALLDGRRTLVAVFASFAALGLARPVLGQDWQELEGVRTHAETVWPGKLGKGYFPVWVDLENDSGERRRIVLEVRIQDSGPEKITRRTVELEPGETRSIELFVPVFKWHMSSYATCNLRLVVGREEDRVTLPISTSGWSEELRCAVLFTPERMEPAVVIELSERLKTADLPSRRQSFLVRSSASTSAPKGDPNVQVAVAQPGYMPSSFHAYTSLDAVIIDARGGLPEGDRLAPLLAWARVGGRVVFLGDGAFEALREHPLAGGWLEERFEISLREQSPAVAPAPDAGRAFGYGLGVLFFGAGEGDLLASEADRSLVQCALFPTGEIERQSGWVPHLGKWRLGTHTIVVPGVGAPPLKVFMALLFLFSIVIGPANRIVLKRMGRPNLQLVTIPVIAFVFSAGLLAYGIFYQGVDIKTASNTLTVLDQRTHRASTVEYRAIYVGLAPGPGLRPASGTAVFPVDFVDRSERYEVDFDAGLLLAGTYLPVRDPRRQVILSDRAARGRLAVEMDAGELRVRNAFDVTIEELYLRDEAGVWHRSDRFLAPGEDAVLDEFEGLGDIPTTFGHTIDMLDGRRLPPSSFLAIVSASAFGDDCALELNELEGRHAIVGILPRSTEDWE